MVRICLIICKVINFIFLKGPDMAKKGVGHARPGSTSTRKVTRGDNKGDTVQFVANKAGTQNPGKQVPRRVVKDVGTKNTASSLPKGKRK